MLNSHKIISISITILLFASSILNAKSAEKKPENSAIKEKIKVKEDITVRENDSKEKLGPAVTKKPEVKPYFDLEQIEKLVKKIKPLVEKHTERKFTKKIEIKLIKSNELKKILKEEFIIQMKNLEPDVSDSERKEQAEQYSAIADGLLGKLGLSTKILYLNPYIFIKLLEKHNIPEEQHNNILKLVVAHELCHVMQDQIVDLGNKIFSIKNQDEMSAYNSTIEGHAMFIMGKVGKDLKIEQAVSEFNKLFFDPDKKNSNIYRKTVIYQFRLTYLGGKKFIQYHFDRGGNEKLWAILKNPPHSTSIILKPETYGQGKIQKLDLQSCLKFLDSKFNTEDWKLRNVEMTDFQLNAAYSNFKPEVKNIIIPNIFHNRVFLAQKSDGSIFNVTLIILKKDLRGPAMVSYLEEYVKSMVEKSKNSTIKFTNLKIDKFKSIEADATSKLSLTIEMSINQKVLHAIRIFRNEMMIEIMAIGYEISDKEIKEIAEKIFESYNNLKKNKENGHSNKNNL